MRRQWALLLGLLNVLLVGCITSESARPKNWWGKLKPFQGPAGNDVVMMDVALLERPVGDLYINQDFWRTADEQVIALERKAVMEDNGFRIGQVGGITPVGLQALLTSDRSCVNPRRIQLHADNATTLTLGPAMPRCQFQVHEEGQARPATFEGATCSLVVVPSLTREGRTRLHFTPQIQYGQAALLPQPAADRSGWEMQEQRPTERYDALSWDVTLASNEYVVIGACFDKPDTLGHQSFIRRDEVTPLQRLLVIRTARQQPELNQDLTPGSPEEEAFRRSPPLAYQAAYTATRGHSD